MSRTVSSEVAAALAAGRLVARDFLWFVVRDRDTGDPVTDGMWSDVGSITCQVISPDTGSPVARTFNGAGMLVSISDIPLVSNLQVQAVTITLSQVVDHVNDLVRGYDCKQGRVEIFRGLFDPDTRSLVAPAEPRFVGFIDEAPITTPKEGEEGSVSLRCKSHTQEMTRSNPDTRSDASQRRRSATDNFYQDVAVVGEWELFWGKSSGTTV
jgi:hypothetical protein